MRVVRTTGGRNRSTEVEANAYLADNRLITEAYTIQGLIRMAEHSGYALPNY